MPRGCAPANSRAAKHTRFREDQRDIRQLERAYQSDGTLTAAERRDLNHELNQSSRQIRRQKHDAQSR